MPASKIQTPRCPRCDRIPLIVLDQQAFCDNESCDVFCWDPTKDRGHFERNATTVRLAPSDRDSKLAVAWSELQAVHGGDRECPQGVTRCAQCRPAWDLFCALVEARNNDSDDDDGAAWCPGCGRYPQGGVCEGPGPYPRPCPLGLSMPT